MATRVDPLVATTPSLSFPPLRGCEKERAWSPTPDTLAYATGKRLLNNEMDDGSMFVISSMITLRPVPAYSHAWPVAPAGSAAPPPPLTPIGLGRLIPSAAPTVAPVGQVSAAAVVVRVASGAAVAAVGAAGVAGAMVGAGVAAADGDPPTRTSAGGEGQAEDERGYPQPARASLRHVESLLREGV